jgi:hypothetical protein
MTTKKKIMRTADYVLDCKKKVFGDHDGIKHTTNCVIH